MSAGGAVFFADAVGAVFLIACLAKVTSGQLSTPFLLAVRVEARTAAAVSRIIPGVEGLVGIMLLLGFLVGPAALAASVLSLGFCVTLIAAYRAGVQQGCRCFGALDSGQLSIVPVARASALAIASLMLVTLAAGDRVFSRNIAAGRFPDDALLGAITGISLVAVFALLEQMRSFEQARPRAIPEEALNAPDSLASV